MEQSSESCRSATVVRRLDQQPDEVWERLTSEEGFDRWMGPGSTIDPSPGGDLVAADPESGEPKIGRVLDVTPPRTIRWVWRPLGEDAPTTEVQITVEPAPTHTVVTVTERPTTIGVTLASGPSARATSAVAAVS